MPLSFLITKWYLTLGNLMLRKKIGIYMGIDPTSYCAGLFLYFLIFYVQKLTSYGSSYAYKLIRTIRFIEDLKQYMISFILQTNISNPSK